MARLRATRSLAGGGGGPSVWQKQERDSERKREKERERERERKRERGGMDIGESALLVRTRFGHGRWRSLVNEECVLCAVSTSYAKDTEEKGKRS